MKFLTILIVITAAFLLYPFFRCFIKRIEMAFKLKRLCAKTGAKLHQNHTLWMLGKRNGVSYDFYIETQKYVYAVKLFGVLRKNAHLTFTEYGEYRIRHFLTLMKGDTGSGFALPFDRKSKKLRFIENVSSIDGCEKKTQIDILLLNPVCAEVKYKPEREEEKALCNGDTVFSFKIESLSNFISEIEKEINYKE